MRHLIRLRRWLRRQITARHLLIAALAATALLLFWKASPIVVLWMVIAELGLYLAYLNGIEAVADYHALEGRSNGRRTIAIGNLRREIVRGLIALDFITIGALVLVGIRGGAAPGLIFASAGMVLNSWLDRRDRLYLLRYGLQARDSSGKFTSDGT